MQMQAHGHSKIEGNLRQLNKIILVDEADNFISKDFASLKKILKEQEFGYRAGTPAVHNIVGFGKAAEITCRDIKNNIKNLKKLETEFIKLLYTNFSNIKLVIDEKNKVPGVVSFILPDVNNQLYLKKLSKEVAFSSGSACTISTESNLLDHIGLGEYKSNFFRVAFGKNNNLNELKNLKDVFV